ncbi:uncharacterized protein LOC111343858 isoform X1 [Stylophora pistillata]|uniref:uncharacterized protein LOC111343858 isoform X1 n=1 Tax=Stylophora pistillata TaxID=50429 RepID=UPI000C03A13B|nr:uncharacterized protein LOC111343858 isoform X1 [Stylophora pistillata]
MAAIRHTCYSDARNNARKEDQCLLGICRIRRKVTGQRRAVTRGCGFLVKDMIIPDPAPGSSGPCCNRSYQYCFITTSQVIDANDPLENFYLEFQKLNKKLKTVPLKKIADLKDVLRTCNLVFIRVKPSRKYPEMKDSIFTYRPFEVTSVNQSHEELECFFVEDKEKSFDVVDLMIQRRVAQNSHKMYFQISDDSMGKVFTTFPHKENSKPYGGVILKRLKHQDDKFLAAGCLNFADDGSLCPVFFPLLHTDTYHDGPQLLNGISSEERASEAANLSHETPVCTAVVTTTHTPLAASGARTTVVTATTTAIVTVTPAAIAPVSTANATVTVTAAPILAPEPSTATTVTVTPIPVPTLAPTATPCSMVTTAPTTGLGGEAAPQVENSSASLTPYPIQEQRLEGTDTEDSAQAGTLPQGEAGNAYENFLVSDKLVLPEYKVLYEKLVRALDNTANRCIANWEHLACADEVKAPSLVRLKCKLSTNYSHTQMLLEVLAVRENEEVVTVKDLIAALRDIKRGDIVNMITDVHDAEGGISSEPIKNFMDCSSNNDLLDRIITGLDDQRLWRVKKHWKHLGIKLGIPKKKLEVIEFCAPFNPTRSLMEYLFTEQNPTVGKFDEKIRQKFKHLDVLTMLGPLLNVVCNRDKLMKDVIDLDNEYMDAFYVRLNKIIPGIENWKDLARAFGIPPDVYKDFNPKEPRSPTKHLFEWMFVNRTVLTVGQLCSALEHIKRNDLVGDVKKYFGKCSSS